VLKKKKRNSKKSRAEGSFFERRNGSEADRAINEKLFKMLETVTL
jgi:hypothetical protein